MPVSDTYLAFLQDQLGWLPQLRIKRMFGGAGLYSGERFFAIAADGDLYLKADAQSEALYRQGGGEQFTYMMKGRLSRMNYWSLPAEAMESPEALRYWVEIALESAMRAKS